MLSRSPIARSWTCSAEAGAVPRHRPGDLPAAPKGAAPALVIRALRDPEGANLDRVQVIKGCSTRRAGRTLGLTVDVADASYAPPRSTAYDAKLHRIAMPPEVPMTTGEHAYTSPIWYTP